MSSEPEGHEIGLTRLQSVPGRFSPLADVPHRIVQGLRYPARPNRHLKHVSSSPVASTSKLAHHITCFEISRTRRSRGIPTLAMPGAG
eukprot:757825-Hanusia_phi.AAC.1